MAGTPLTAVVAGHICLDIIPTIFQGGGYEQAFLPGRLVEVGAARLATGGVVSNTGLALYKQGIATRLMGKVGDDIFGHAILALLASYDSTLSERMIVSPGEATSYSIVISPPHVDRIFLHYPGTNDTFGATDIAHTDLQDVSLFHLGYPPLMQRLYADGGSELAAIFHSVKACRITTSLDMAQPDPESVAGRADWPAILQRVLPEVDVFLPSFDEILFMLDRHGYDRWKQSLAADDLIAQADGRLLRELSDLLIAWGAGVVGIKLGDQGLYLRTSASKRRWEHMGKGVSGGVMEGWRGRELLAPCFFVEAVGTTGAGDATVAGFLAGILHGMAPEEALTRAVAVGACNVEAADAISGVQSWEKVEQRMKSGWQRRPISLSLPGWSWVTNPPLWVGPDDPSRR